MESNIKYEQLVKKKYVSDRRMLQLVSILLEREMIRFRQDFIDEIGISKQAFVKIKNGERHFTPEHIQKACKVYKVNANWVFGLDKDIFRH